MMLYNISGELNDSLIESSMDLHNEEIAKDVINNLTLAQKRKAKEYIDIGLSFSRSLNEIYVRETVKSFALMYNLSIGKYVKLGLLPSRIFDEVMYIIDSFEYTSIKRQLFDKLISKPFDLLPSQCESEIDCYTRLVTSRAISKKQLDNYINNKNLLPSQILRIVFH